MAGLAGVLNPIPIQVVPDAVPDARAVIQSGVDGRVGLPIQDREGGRFAAGRIGVAVGGVVAASVARAEFVAPWGNKLHERITRGTGDRTGRHLRLPWSSWQSARLALAARP